MGTKSTHVTDLQIRLDEPRILNRYTVEWDDAVNDVESIPNTITANASSLQTNLGGTMSLINKGIALGKTVTDILLEQEDDGYVLANSQTKLGSIDAEVRMRVCASISVLNSLVALECSNNVGVRGVSVQDSQIMAAVHAY